MSDADKTRKTTRRNAGATPWRQGVLRLVEGRVIPPSIASSLQRAHRTGKVLTSRWRPLPGLLLAGVEKSGTTSMFRYLAAHPSIVPLEKKEINYFNSPALPSVSWYRSHSPLNLRLRATSALASAPALTFDATPAYFFHPLAPARALQVLPDVKIIVLLRNPIDRAFSHYVHRRTAGWETESFEAACRREAESLTSLRSALIADPAMTGPAADAFRRPCYLARGVYADQLQRWLDHFDPTSLLILNSDDLFGHAAATMEKVLNFLELPAARKAEYPKYNPKRREDALGDMHRAELADYFRPHNERLEKLVGYSFDWE